MLLRYTADIARIDELMPAHVAWLDTHYAAGDFVASGRQVPRTGGVILARTADRETLKAIVAQDPFGQAGAASYEIIEFTPTKTAPEFSGLAG